MRSSLVFGVALALAIACTERGPQPSEPEAEPSEAEPSEAKPAEAKPIEAKPSEAKPIDLFAPASEVFAEVGRRWCESGGENFRPPGTPDEEFPPRLESCDVVEITLHSRLEAEGLHVEFVTIDFPMESRELLLLQSATHAALLETDHEVGDTSGEAGTYYRTRESIELRDLTGTPLPEWTVRLAVSGGDSYEADRCYATDEERRSILVCSELASGFACGELEYWNTHTLTRRDNLDECSIPRKELEQKLVTGFARELEIARDRIVLTPAKLKIDEPEDTDLDEEPEEPHLVGEVSLAELLAEPLETLAAQSRTSVTTP